MEWQKIETAPKDETDILACLIDEDLQYMDVIYWGQIGVEDDEMWLTSCGAEEVYSTPTHWMPLPEAPKL